MSAQGTVGPAAGAVALALGAADLRAERARNRKEDSVTYGAIRRRIRPARGGERGLPCTRTPRRCLPPEEQSRPQGPQACAMSGAADYPRLGAGLPDLDRRSLWDPLFLSLYAQPKRPCQGEGAARQARQRPRVGLSAAGRLAGFQAPPCRRGATSCRGRRCPEAVRGRSSPGRAWAFRGH